MDQNNCEKEINSITESIAWVKIELENDSIINESNNSILDKNDDILETFSIDRNKYIE